jgi:putative FmdB family regulatory protein
MPIYEFYCPDCNTVYSFFSARIDTEARPACPKCGRTGLGRRPSRFATLKPGRAEESESDADDPFAGIDEERMERAAEAMAGEFEGMDDNAEPDPRQMSRMLRRFTELTGLEAGPKLNDMLARLERGEDPEALESEMGDGGEGDDDLSELFALKKKLLASRAPRPKVDETLYFL